MNRQTNRQMKIVNALTWIASLTSLNGNKQELFISQISEMWQPFHTVKHPLVNALISSNDRICRYNCLARLNQCKQSYITISFWYLLYWQWNSQHLYYNVCHISTLCFFPTLFHCPYEEYQNKSVEQLAKHGFTAGTFYVYAQISNFTIPHLAQLL